MATATSNGKTAAELAAQAGVTEAEVIAEQQRFPDLNPDALIGNIVGRKTRDAAGQNSMSASAPAGYGINAAGGFVPNKPQPAEAPQPPAAPDAPAAPAAPDAAAAPEKPADGAGGGSGEAKGSVYTVAAGDNLTKIARKLGLPVATLIAANPQIKNPNLIYAGSVLNVPAGTQPQPFQMPSGYEQINGALYGTRQLQEANFSDIRVDPTGTFLYGKRISVAAQVNEEAKASMDIAEEARNAAGEKSRFSEQEDALRRRLEAQLGIGADEDKPDDSVTTSDGTTISLEGDQSALALYRELMNTQEITSLQKQMAAKKEELEKLTASEVALASDILKEVQGEAPQSYIDALVAERSKDLYPRKLALTAEYNNLVAQYTAARENAANILQYTLHDADNRYNRMFAMLQFYAQQDQQKLSNEIAVMGLLKDLPANRSITINGKTYKGINEDAALNVIQFTDAAGKITVVGIDKQTGEVKYTKVIGHAKVGGSGDSWSKKLSEKMAELDYNTLSKLEKGELAYTRSEDGKNIVLYDKGAYKTAVIAWNKDFVNEGFFNSPFNNTSITIDGITYDGEKSTEPSIYDHEVIFNK